MTQITLVPEDGKIRVGDRVIAYDPNLQTRFSFDLSVIHAIQYDTDTEEGHVEYKPGKEHKNVSTDQVGMKLGKEIGKVVEREFDNVLGNIESRAKGLALKKNRLTEVTQDSPVVKVNGTVGLEPGQELEGTDLFPEGTTIVSVDSGTELTLSDPAKASSKDSVEVDFITDKDVRLTEDKVVEKVRNHKFFNFDSHPRFGLDLTS